MGLVLAVGFDSLPTPYPPESAGGEYRRCVMGFESILDAPSFVEWWRETARAVVRAQAEPLCVERCWCQQVCEPVESPDEGVERFGYEADGFMPEWAADRLAVEWASGGASW